MKRPETSINNRLLHHTDNLFTSAAGEKNTSSRLLEIRKHTSNMKKPVECGVVALFLAHVWVCAGGCDVFDPVEHMTKNAEWGRMMGKRAIWRGIVAVCHGLIVALCYVVYDRGDQST